MLMVSAIGQGIVKNTSGWYWKKLHCYSSLGYYDFDLSLDQPLLTHNLEYY